MPKLRAALALFALLAVALLGSPASAKDELVIGVAQFPETLHPYIEESLVGAYIRQFATRPITAFDEAWNNVCSLCTEAPSLSNGLVNVETRPDGSASMAVKLTLKPDLYWGDGQKVTTKDLEFTGRMTHDPKSGAGGDAVTWQQVSRIEVLDEQAAIMHFDRPSSRYSIWWSLMPEHIEGPILAAAAAPLDYVNQTRYSRAPTTPGLYNGPYLVTSYQSGAQVVLEPNPYWRGKKPVIKRIVIRMIANTAAPQANLLSGDVDMAGEGGTGLTVDQVIGMQKQYSDRFQFIFRSSPNFERLDLKLDNPILADVRVRRALLMALDRKTLAQTIYDGRATVADTWMSPLDPNHAPDVVTYAYDPAHAKALLAEAGWTPGADGICRNAAGDRLSLEFRTVAGNRLRELEQTTLQNAWKAACIEITIRNEPLRTLLGDTLRHRTFNGMVMLAWNVDGVGWVPQSVYATAYIPTAANNWSGANYTGFSDPAMDAALDRANAELDPVKHKAFLEEVQRIYAEQLPQLPLIHRPDGNVVPKWLKGFVTTGLPWTSSLWAENWRSE